MTIKVIYAINRHENQIGIYFSEYPKAEKYYNELQAIWSQSDILADLSIDIPVEKFADTYHWIYRPIKESEISQYTSDPDVVLRFTTDNIDMEIYLTDSNVDKQSIAPYELLDIEMAKREYSDLWSIFSDIIGYNISHDKKVNAILSVALSICPYCKTVQKNCNCWKDE